MGQFLTLKLWNVFGRLPPKKMVHNSFLLVCKMIGRVLSPQKTDLVVFAI